MHLVLIGLSYKTTPISLREKMSFTKAQLPTALASLASLDEVSECVILSTCNRTEIYAYTRQRTTNEEIIAWICDFCHISLDELVPHLYTRCGEKAAEHLFRVIPGLDSMVLGETQITGQTKEAYTAAQEANTVGPVLNALFQQASSVGKKVVSETDICRGVFSVGSAAARLAKSVFGDLKSSTLLIVGAGKMAELTTSYLSTLGVTKLMVANRTYERAQLLAARFNGEVVCYDDLSDALKKADIVITSTGSEHTVISKEIIATAMRARKGQPMFVIDMAVPRDVEQSVSDIDNVILYNVDDLEAVVAANGATRHAEVQKAELIVAAEVQEFNRWFQTLDAVPVITAMRDRIDGIRQTEMEKLAKKLQHLDPDDIAAINATLNSIVNKICHEHVVKIKECACAPGSTVKLEVMSEAFGLRSSRSHTLCDTQAEAG